MLMAERENGNSPLKAQESEEKILSEYLRFIHPL